MAAEKRKPPRGKGGKKPLRGKMPVKRSINLILVDENKISIPKAILGILVIILLAGVFAKYMVIDRLMDMVHAEARANQAKDELVQAEALLQSFGDVESDYAHYTVADMTAAELGLVDRTSVLKLVRTMLPSGETTLSPAGFIARLRALLTAQYYQTEEALTPEEFSSLFWELIKRIIPAGYSVQSWSVTDNLLTLEMKAVSLERLNKLARELEQADIVDSCAIITANKRDTRRGSVETTGMVQARLLVYLRQPPQKEEEAQ